MATAVPVLERTQEESSLKAYGKLQGGVAPQEMTEEQKALAFNARISENYQKLINPDYHKAEDVAVAPAYAEPAYAEPVYAAPVQEAAPAYTRQRAADIFRADSPLHTRTVDFASAPAYAEPAYAEPSYAAPVQETPAAPYYEQAAYAEDVTDADLMPTETTNQYRDSLYREERPAEHAQEKKKGFALTARNKLLIAVYSIVVVVVLALIIVNTSVLGSLDAEVTAREAALNAAIETSQNLEAEINYYTDADTIISRAEDELGMYMPD